MEKSCQWQGGLSLRKGTSKKLFSVIGSTVWGQQERAFPVLLVRRGSDGKVSPASSCPWGLSRSPAGHHGLRLQGRGKKCAGLPGILVPWERDHRMPLTHSPLVPKALNEDVLEVAEVGCKEILTLSIRGVGIRQRGLSKGHTWFHRLY